MKLNDKITLQSEAVALFERLTGLSVIKKIPVVGRLATIIELLVSTVVAYVAPIFERAKNIAQFHLNAKQFAGGSDTVRGVSLDVLNDAGQALVEVQDRFNMPKMKFFGSGSRAPYKSRLSGSAQACYIHSRGKDFTAPHYIDQILINTKMQAVPTPERAEGIARVMLKRYPLDAHQRTANKRVTDPDALAVVMALDVWRWSHSPTATEMLQHEAGHRLHSYMDSMDIPINQVLGEGYRGGWHYCISQYGMTNVNEFMAESFVCYMQDKHEFIYPPLLELYKKHDKAVV